ncbi:hypothetical protein [Intestinimonas butyriciproducens]|uniref:hypothetical protein n=1 Tax=Intestinimonas butyriciproducens TaxID=1297617 RepID=UPI0034A415A9
MADELEQQLGEAGNKALYRRYEGAHSAYLALCERASLLCGAHTALRLLLTLL